MQIHCRHLCHQTPNRGIHQFATPSGAGEVPVLVSTGALVAREEERIGNTIPMPTFASRPSAMRSLSPVDIPQSSVVGQQRQQISELQFDKFPTPSSFLLEDKIQKPGDHLF